MRWDDLRFVLAVAHSGSLTGAARALHVNRTTVLRRINAFERAHGVRVFERAALGYELTDAGEELVTAARSLESTVATLERQLAGRDLRLEGPLHVTTTDTLLGPVLAGPLAAFRRENPGIVLQISASNSMFDLAQRDADVAVRPALDVPPELIGRRICRLAFAVYGPASLAPERHEIRQRLTSHPWVAPDDTLAGTSVLRWMRSSLAGAGIVARLDSLLAMGELCAAGAGLAALPCYLGDTDERVVRITPPVPQMATALWVLTHPDLARTARVRLFIESMAEALRGLRPLLEGQRPRL